MIFPIRTRCAGCGEKDWSINLIDYWYPGNALPKQICKPCHEKTQEEELDKRREGLARIARIREEELELIALEKKQQAKDNIKPISAEQEDIQTLKALWTDLTHYYQTGEWDASEEESDRYLRAVQKQIYKEER